MTACMEVKNMFYFDQFLKLFMLAFYSGQFLKLVAQTFTVTASILCLHPYPYQRYFEKTFLQLLAHSGKAFT